VPIVLGTGTRTLEAAAVATVLTLLIVPAVDPATVTVYLTNLPGAEIIRVDVFMATTPFF
jgi:hypothetical protein